MDLFCSLPVTALVLLLAWILFRYLTAAKNLPPGPLGLPVVGYLPFVGSPPHIKLQALAKRYGSICSFYFGTNLVVMLSDYDVIREALVKKGDIFSGRPQSFQFKVFPTDIGIITSEGDDFKAMKCFVLHTLKEAGGVKAEIETKMQDNVESFLSYLRSTGGEPVDVLEPLGLNVAMTYSLLLLNKRFALDDPWFLELINSLYNEQRMYGNGIRIYLPWTRKVPLLSKWVKEDEAQATRKHIYEHLDEQVQECERTYLEGSTSNFIHAWITQERSRKDKDSNDTLFDRRHLLHNLAVVFAGGYETTTTTLLWGLIYLATYPSVQQMIQKEIDGVIGRDRCPTILDESRMHYTLATIQEIHRYATIGPLGVLHSNIEETTLCGYTIPKRSFILTNFLAVHSDPKNFPEPDQFKPERHLDRNGQFKKAHKVLSFSLGKRQCPGEQLAAAQIFNYLVSILQHFHIVKPQQQEFCLQRSGNLSCAPQQFKVRFIERQSQ